VQAIVVKVVQSLFEIIDGELHFLSNTPTPSEGKSAAKPIHSTRGRLGDIWPNVMQE
jgi:hypothetical protein